MLADTIEAACHTLENPTSPRLDKFITILINQKVDAKQLDNCDLTFRDISKIKAAFVNLLTGYYHNRIKYQNQQDPDQAPAKAEENTNSAEAAKTATPAKTAAPAKPAAATKTALTSKTAAAKTSTAAKPAPKKEKK